MRQRRMPDADYIARLRAAYLDLMRDSLTGRLNEDPPLPASKVDGYKPDYREQGWDWPSKAPSMIGTLRMQNVRSECERVIADNIPGDFVEAGVWRGGAAIMMRAVLAVYDIKDRRVFAADSFEGFPAQTGVDTNFTVGGIPDFAVSLDEVKANFSRYGLLDNQVVFLKGMFKDTLPSAPTQAIAVLRLDGDLYESTRDGLVLYDKLSRGGTLIADDYFLFEGQRKAIDEFRNTRGIADPIVRIDHFGGYWIKR
jgi:O-methyltransferase